MCACGLFVVAVNSFVWPDAAFDDGRPLDGDDAVFIIESRRSGYEFTFKTGD